eukprot:gene10339-2753_t
MFCNLNSDVPEEKIIRLANLIQVSYPMAKQLLRKNNNDVSEAVKSFSRNETTVLTSVNGKDDILMNFMKEFSELPPQNIVKYSKNDPYKIEHNKSWPRKIGTINYQIEGKEPLNFQMDQKVDFVDLLKNPNQKFMYYDNNLKSEIESKFLEDLKTLRSSKFIEGNVTLIEKKKSKLNNDLYILTFSIEIYFTQKIFENFFYGTEGILTSIFSKLQDGRKEFPEYKDFTIIENDFSVLYETTKNYPTYNEKIPNLKLELQPFQKQSLRFLIDRENSNECISSSYYDKYYFEDGTAYYVCSVGDSPLLLDLPDIRGGFLSDELGLGKSIEIISLLLIQGCRIKKLSSTIREGIHTYYNGGTLIIVPPTILHLWENEIKKNVEKNTIKYYLYHGSSRNREPKVLASYDVIFTTYSVLSSDHKRHQQNMTTCTDPIKDIIWNRIILDESHYIKQAKSSQNDAISNIKARNRWCISATPIQTDIADLHGQFKFLNLIPFNKEEYVKPNVCIQNVLGDCMMRISKSIIEKKNMIFLPEKKIEPIFIKLTEDEQKVYNFLLKKSNEKLQILRGKSQRVYTKLLVSLLKLRQTASHFSMINLAEFCDTPLSFLPQSFSLSNLAGAEIQNVDINNIEALTWMNESNFIQDVVSRIKNADDLDCPICLDVVESATVTQCGHIFCKECIIMQVNTNRICPICRKQIDETNLTIIDDGNKPIEEKRTRDIYGVPEDIIRLHNNLKKLPGTKIEALLKEIENEKKNNTKCLIFSQWKEMFTQIKLELEKQEILYVELNGTMTTKQRENALKEFHQNPKVNICLMSLRSASLGLSCRANTIFIMEPSLNESLEEQAVIRLHGHRIDSTELVIKKFITLNTVEEKLYNFHEKFRDSKGTILKDSLSPSLPKESKNYKIEELLKLFSEDEEKTGEEEEEVIDDIIVDSQDESPTKNMQPKRRISNERVSRKKQKK